MAKAKKVKKRVVKIDSEGLVFIKSTFNNIIISVCNKQGQVISWASSGKHGFRGAKKTTPYASHVCAADAAKGAADAAKDAGGAAADAAKKAAEAMKK